MKDVFANSPGGKSYDHGEVPIKIRLNRMTVKLLLSYVSNNVETIEEYDRMVGIELPDALKLKLVKI